MLKTMSFLQAICQKKDCLKKARTIVTRLDGKQFLFDKEISRKPFGFVIDTKPDNIPVEIVKHIFLGSQDCCDLEILQNFNIINVLSVGILPPCVFPNVEYKFVECLDLPETDIMGILKNDCVPFLKCAVDSCRNTLVHCNAGISRSSTVVLGFLIVANKYSYKEAFDIVKRKRNCIKPNIGFEKQLRELERLTL